MMLEKKIFSEAFLPEILELCNNNMKFDRLTEALLREKILEDPDYTPELILTTWERGELVGFMSGLVRRVRDEKIGYIKMMVVREERRREGIARNMYHILEEAFRSRGAVRCRIYDVPMNYFMPGIDPRYTPAICFAQRLGFNRFADTSNMLAPLQGQDFSTLEKEKKLAGRDVTIHRASPEDRDEMLVFIDRHFDLWRAEVENMFRSIPVSLHIARHNGELFAFSGHNGNNIGTGWFGPMGTHPEKRGMGVGGVLLKRCLQDMKDWGLEYSIIPWVGPIDFYAHYVNAFVDRVFWRYEKTLT
jgi:GNAT superfamily N-acetyltransferase